MSLTLLEARARAAALSEVSYEIDLDLRQPSPGPSGTFGSRTTVRFTTTTPQTFLELAAATALAVEVDGEPTDAAYDGRRLTLTGLAPGAHEVVVTARLPYVSDGDGMHLFTDPADGETYASAYLGMDVAQKVYACFDQNDLKAPMTLRVSADPAWTVLGNGRVVAQDSEPSAGRWAFATTPPLPPAMFVVCAGPWHSRTWEHAGLPFGWHARRSLAADLDRDFDELRTTTEACFAWYTSAFEEPFPFDSYDQAFVPGHNWGALETPGCITYRDEYLPRQHTSELVRGGRASTMAHEMAHIWFGDLVTMTWWEDTWLQESFADMLGYRLADEAVGRRDGLVRNEASRKITGLEADGRRSTHPVAPHAEDVPDVDAAAGNFDMISYAKGNAALRQLTVWLGDDAFLAGLNTYLSRHRFANTTLDDFVAALDEVSERDVAAWVEVWLRRSGFDTIRVTRDETGVPVLTRDGVRPHRIGVTAFDESLAEIGTELIDLDGEPVRLEQWAGRIVVPNSHGETFARLAFDDLSWQALSDGLSRVEDDHVRAVVWATAFAGVHDRSLAPDAYLDLVERHLPGERSFVLAGAVVARTLNRVLPLRVPADAAGTALARLASACSTGLAHATDPELAHVFVDGLAASTDETETLLAWLDADAVGDLPLTPSTRWTAVHRLAQLGAADAAFVEAERRRDSSVQGELGAATALAARPTREAKEAAWAAIVDPDVSNRRLEAVAAGLWSVEQADLVAPYVDRYLAEAPTWAARGQAFAQVVGHAFPALALTDDQLGAFETALAGDLPAVLRRKWEDRLDDLR